MLHWPSGVLHYPDGDSLNWNTIHNGWWMYWCCCCSSRPTESGRIEWMEWPGWGWSCHYICAVQQSGLHVHRYWNPECNKMMIRQRLSECRLLDAHHWYVTANDIMVVVGGMMGYRNPSYQNNQKRSCGWNWIFPPVFTRQIKHSRRITFRLMHCNDMKDNSILPCCVNKCIYKWGGGEENIERESNTA